MYKKFNINGVCYLDRHYMVDFNRRLQEIKVMVDNGDYFVISRARQYGKTTTLRTLNYPKVRSFYEIKVSKRRKRTFTSTL